MIDLDNSDSDDESLGSKSGTSSVSPPTNLPSSTVADHAIEKLVIENNIFLKAALQLLDQRDRSIDDNTRNFNEGSSADVIMCGKLKKGSSGAVSRVWKDKFVELRHGELSYEDITGWGQKSNKKTLPLIVRQVICRPSQKYHGHVFEIRDLDNEGRIVHHHNRKKLFMAESTDEMGRWIEAIRTAMIGSAGDFGPNDAKTTGSGEDNHTVRSDESELQNTIDDWRPLHVMQMGSSDSNDIRPISAIPKLFTSSRKTKKHLGSDSAEGFSNEMKRFEYIKTIIHAADSPQAYRECLLDQVLDNVITIPVAYMKKHLRQSTLGNYSLRTTGSLTHQEREKQEKELAKQAKKEKRRQGKRIRQSVFSSNKNRKDSDHNLHWNLMSKPTSIENSQAWKDLFRDVININGDIINGGVEGPEAMIGALVRHILLQVQKMRENWVSYQQASSLASEHESSRQSVEIEQHISLERARLLASTYSDLDEGQALSIARDVLLSCNRTESGGDTYYCVQALLCNDNFAVLTPHGCAVDPIEIVVDVVESNKKKFSRPRSHGEERSTQSGTNSPLTHAGHHHRHPPNHHLHQLSGIIEVSSPKKLDEDDDEHITTIRDSTTVESDVSSGGDGSHVPSSTIRTHYPESLLNAAAAQVKERGQRVHDIDSYYDPAELVLQSDIPGASALPSNMLLLKEVSKRKKRLSQPGYVDGSDSENEMSEDGVSNTSEKDSDNEYMERSKPKLELKSADYGIAVNQRAAMTTPNRPTPVFQVNCDDATVAMSELTMDSAPAKTRRKSSVSDVLRKNLGFGGDSDDLASPTKKRHSIFSWSSTKDSNSVPYSPDPIVRNSATFTSPPPSKSHLSWRSGKSTNTEDSGSVTDQRHSSVVEDDLDEQEETAAQSMCIRVQVIVKSRYRLCNLDPQDENEDTWANITGQFHQNFFLKSNSNGRPAVSDRFVTVKVDDPSVGY